MTALLPKKSRVHTLATRRKCVFSVTKDGMSVAEVAKDNGIARKTLYKWINTYKSSSKRVKSRSLESKYRKGIQHPRSHGTSLKSQIIRIVTAHPEWGVRKISQDLKKHGLNVGYFAVHTVLQAMSLETRDLRESFSTNYAGPGRYRADVRIEIVRKVQGGESVTDLSREYDVSRKTIYAWVAKATKSEDVKHALKDAYVVAENHPRAVYPQIESSVLSQVKKHPEYSAHRLADTMPVSSWTVWSILNKNGLNTFENRRKYSGHVAGVHVPSPAPQKAKTVLEQFVPNLAPAPPPGVASLVRAFLYSTTSTIVVSLTFRYWIDIILSASSTPSAIGLVFATVALFVGSLFFLYSLKYYITLAIVLSHSQSDDDSEDESGSGVFSWILGKGDRGTLSQASGLEPDLENVHLDKFPYVSVQIPFFNEKYVAERAMTAALNFDYKGDYEVMICDDSTDETTEIIRKYQKRFLHKGQKLKTTKNDKEGWELSTVETRPGVFLKHLHRTTRSGYKGGALAVALSLVEPRCEFITIFDADFVPYPDSLDLFLKYFKLQNKGSEDYSKSRVAVVQGYQWHVLNKSENWITRGVRSEYSGSYVVERSGQEIYGGMKHISGSVYMIRKQPLQEVGWDTSITEDYELTLRLYEKGYKVLYTPYIQAPAECVSTLKRLIRQRMRWAEGHSYNVKIMWKRLLWGKWEVDASQQVFATQSSKLMGDDRANTKSLLTLLNRRNQGQVFVPSPLTGAEKVEFVFNIPYYLQAFFFLIGTFSWLISETIFGSQLPFWTTLWGWSLVLTNLFALPLVNAVGLFLEESEERDYAGLASFVVLSYIVVPFQAYAAVKGFLEKEEGGWFRTPKTGRITDVFARGKFMRFIQGVLPGRVQGEVVGSEILNTQLHTPNSYFSLSSANSKFNSFHIKPRRLRWVSKFVLVILLSTTLILNSMVSNVPQASAIDQTGDGHDGALSTNFSSFEYEAIDTISGSGETNADRIQVASTTNITSGDDVLVIQMTGTGEGNWETCDVSSIVTNDYVDCAVDLTNTYQASGAQLVVMPQWTSVTLGSGESITTSAWDGTTGGIIAFRATGTVDVQSGASIDADGDGFDGGTASSGGAGGTGGAAGNDPGTIGTAGTAGTIGSGDGAGSGGGTGGNPGSGGNGGNNGGGGAGGTGGGGAGGTYAVGASAGTAGTSGTGGNGAGSGGTGGSGSAGSAGSAGSTYGVADLGTMFLGSGGGSGASGAGGGGGGARSGNAGGGGGSGGASGAGGNGGGIIVAYADTFTVNSGGTITADGAAGSAGSDGVVGTNPASNFGGGGGGGGAPGGGGGGGSGGSIFLRGDTVTLGSEIVTALGGSAGSGGTTGGAGGSATASGGASSAGAGGGGSSRNVAGSAASGGSAGGGSAGNVGRIHVEYLSTTGSSNPDADTLEIPEVILLFIPLALLIPYLVDRKRRERLIKKFTNYAQNFLDRRKPIMMSEGLVRPPPG